jgi:nucleotide-binding universal stress UspA family protein
MVVPPLDLCGKSRIARASAGPSLIDMYGRILVGYQDTEQARDALELGRILAQANRAEMLVVTAPSDDGENLSRLARAEGADLIVLGSTHRGPVGRIVPGATVARLLADGPCAVAVAPTGFGRRPDVDNVWKPLSGEPDDVGIRVVGVGYDGTKASVEALKIAVELAVPNGAAVRVYAVAPKKTAIQAAAAGGAAPVPAAAPGPGEAVILRESLHRAVAALPSEARALPILLHGVAATELVRAARLGVDLLVLGSRPGGPIRRSLHHSVSNAVLAEAPCPVLIAPSGVRAPLPV